MSTSLLPADDLLHDPLADLPWAPRPDTATVVHVPSLLRPRERSIDRIDRRHRLGRWLQRRGHDLVERRTICAINGEWLPRARWIAYRPRKGDLILLIDHPYAGGDGGSNPLAAILMIAAIVFMPYAMPALTGLGLSTGMAQAVYMLGVNLLVSALTGPPKPPASHAQAEMAQPSPTYTLGAQGNSNRLGSPRPRHYGRFRFTPAYCAQPYGEFVNNEHYLYELLDVGLGEYQIDQISIEDTDIAAFADIEYEVIPPGGAITLVPGRVHNSGEVAGQELLQGAWIGGAIGFVAVPAGSLATAIGIDYVCPAGLFSVNDDGSFAALSIQIRFEAISIDDAGNPTGAWFPLGEEVLSAATNTPQRRTKLYPVSSARYAVRATRVDTKNTSARAGHEVTWAALRAHLPGDLVYPDNTVIAIKAKASGQLTQASARKVYVQGVGKVKTWSPSGWTAPVASRSIAWAAADILMADYGRNAAAALLDLDKLYQLEQVWMARGDTFDASFDTRSTVSEALTGALKCGRAQWFQIAGLYSFARDEAVTVPSATFTPQNIVRGSVEVEYVMPGDRTADYVIGKYFDTQVFNWREVECKLTGSTSAKPARVTYFGIGDHDHAWREGITDAAENLYRRRIVKFSTEMEGRLLLPLDTIALSHTLINRAQTGEVVAFSGDDGVGGLAAGAELVLSGEVEFAAGQTHYLIMSTLTGGRSGPWRVTAGATPERVLLDEAVSDFQPYVGGGKQRSRYAFGIGSEVYVLGKVVPPLKLKGRQVEIQMVVDDPRVHNADQIHILPAPAVGWGLPKAPERPVLASLLISQSGDPASPVITASWPETAGALFYVVEWSADALDWRRAGGDTSGSNLSFSVPPGALHVRACAVGKVAGPWVAWAGVAGEVPPPGRPQGLALVETWLGARARWKWSEAVRAASYEVEIHAGGALRRSFETTALTYSYDADQIRADGGPWRSVEIKVRAKAPTGNSDWVSLTSVNPQVGPLTGVQFATGHLQIIGSYGLPADTDFAGVRVAMSKTSAFDQTDPANLAYDGYDQIFVLTKSPDGAAFIAADVWYIRIAGYDRFGADDLQWSAEYQVTVAAIDANLTPEQVLEKLNSSFTQGNVVLAGSGAITVYNGSPSTPNRDFVLLNSGTISFQRYRGGQYQEYKSLKRVEVGVAPSGQTVTVPGYWDQQPRVTVSPQSLKSYSASFSSQDQTWACRADNLREDPAASGIWKFDAVAELHLASAAGTTSLNQTTGNTASNTWDSSVYTLPPNTHDITVNVQAKSKRGTGAHTTEWAYRRITATVYTYSPAGGWVQSGQAVILPGTQLDTALLASIGCFNLATGTDSFYVHFAATDEGGTFSTGVDTYNYGQDTVIGSNGSAGFAFCAYNQGYDQNGSSTALVGGLYSARYTMPSYSPPAGWEVTSTSYTYSICARVYAASHYFVAPDRNTYYTYGTTTWGWRTTVDGVFVFHYVGKTASLPGAYDPNGFHAEIYSPGMSGGVHLKDVVATVYRRQLITNSLTPVNAFTLGSYDWQVASASALSTGSLNFMAVGD